MSAAPKDGGPAFPARPTEHLHGGATISAHHGMSLRDWFAGQALVGVASDRFGARQSPGETKAQADARWAYGRADAMLAARGQS